MIKVFIDGSAGTTGLRIHERLSARPELELLRLPEALRKDREARRDALNAADVAFLCLPDAAAEEAAALVENPDTALIDTSTAHRTAEGWVYGFPELTGQREAIRAAKRVANPGCHASGFISLVAPLVERGLLSPEAHLSCFSLTGYSGGGKKMIAEYEAAAAAGQAGTDRAGSEETGTGARGPAREPLLAAPRQYGLGQSHKHLPEMVRLCGLRTAPVFCPVVAPYYAGMEVTVSLFAEELHGDAAALGAFYRDYYREGLVRYADGDEAGFLSACALEGRDDMVLTVRGNAERILLISRFDNLGKGASGAAIQNMNLLLGLDERAGLAV